jgi:hypothetical protein
MTEDEREMVIWGKGDWLLVVGIWRHSELDSESYEILNNEFSILNFQF